MRLNSLVRGLGVLATAALLPACKSLDVENPNDPDAVRALSDPIAIEALAAGTIRTWTWTYTELHTTGVLSTQARTLSSSWNNGNMNFYSGVDISPSDTAAAPANWTRNSRPWQNDPSAAGRTSVEGYWFGYYSALSSANTALRAIRKSNLVIADAGRTKRAETIAQLMQGASLMQLALLYDKAYIVDEDSDLASLAYSDRKAVRDAAETKLLAAVQLATNNTFTTDPTWSGGTLSYSNTQIAKIGNTLLAMLIAWYPRDDAEAATVNWSKVATYAAAGMSSGTPVTFGVTMDCFDGGTFCNFMLPWFTDYGTGRISTRVAHFVDPSTQRDPYPLGIGNPRPNSPDKRMGDGSFGNAGMVRVYGNVPKTASAGTDFAWSSQGEIYRPDRGYYHQSNIGITRWDESGVLDPDLQWGGYGFGPIITPAVNDLLWAEALLRQGAAGAAQAATLINNTRVTRGNLPPATVADGVGSPNDGPCMSNNILAKNGGACTLFSKLLYEMEIELLQLGPAPYFNQRHLPVLQGGGAFDSPNGTKVRYIQGLIPGTPRDMPVPARELGVKGEPLYTFGGSGSPKSPAP